MNGLQSCLQFFFLRYEHLKFPDLKIEDGVPSKNRSMTQYAQQNQYKLAHTASTYFKSRIMND